MRVLSGLFLLAVAIPTRVVAQNDCFPSKQSHEAQTFGILSVPLAFSAVEAPSNQSGHVVRIGVVVSSVPNVDATTSTPTTCRPGKGPENTNLLNAVPSPRIEVALPGHFAVEASWVPPVTVNQVKADLISLALSKTVSIANGLLALRARAHGTLGVVHAPITCDDQALKDPTSECFNGTRSDDTFHPNIFGADLTLGWSPPSSRLRPYVGAGYNRLQPRFRVNFTNSFGDIDRTRVTVDLNRLVVFGGATWRIVRALDLSGEVYAAPSDAVTARVGVRAGI